MAFEPDDMIARLTLEAAFLMEDAAPLLVRRWPDDAEAQKNRVDHLWQVTDALSALATATCALYARRSRMRDDAR